VLLLGLFTVSRASSQHAVQGAVLVSASGL